MHPVQQKIADLLADLSRQLQASAADCIRAHKEELAMRDRAAKIPKTHLIPCGSYANVADGLRQQAAHLEMAAVMVRQFRPDQLGIIQPGMA